MQVEQVCCLVHPVSHTWMQTLPRQASVVHSPEARLHKTCVCALERAAGIVCQQASAYDGLLVSIEAWNLNLMSGDFGWEHQALIVNRPNTGSPGHIAGATLVEGGGGVAESLGIGGGGPCAHMITTAVVIFVVPWLCWCRLCCNVRPVH